MFGKSKEKSEEQHIIDEWRKAIEYKVICGGAEDVELRMNKLYPLYELDVFKENIDVTSLCVVMKKTGIMAWRAYFYKYLKGDKIGIDEIIEKIVEINK
jgi:hypothetical protein